MLTNDSDFFIYDLPAGVVPLDYVNLTVKQLKCDKDKNEIKCKNDEWIGNTERFGMNVQLYKLDDMIGLFKLAERPMVRSLQHYSETMSLRSIISKRFTLTPNS